METAERNRRRLNGRSHRYFRHPSLVALLPADCHTLVHPLRAAGGSPVGALHGPNRPFHHHPPRDRVAGEALPSATRSER